jgi:uncharacterized damage-inducible protein DinB
MDPRIAVLADTLRLNTKLFRNCLAGMTDEQANVRPTAASNSAAFIAAHLTEARYYLLKLLGAEEPNPIGRYLAGARSLDDLEACPPLAETLAAWTAVAHALRDRLERLTPEDLDAAITTRFPTATPTILGVLAFLVQHDSYHIGQLALLRRQIGLPPMSYT